jgi:hypothetical protein
LFKQVAGNISQELSPSALSVHHTGNCSNSLAPSVGTIQDRFQKKKTVMVTTRSSQNAGAPPQGAVNAEVPPHQTPDVATLQATIVRMQKDMEELQRINATLRQQTGNGEEHSSHNHLNENQGGGPEPSNHLSENQGGDPEPSIQEENAGRPKRA